MFSLYSELVLVTETVSSDDLSAAMAWISAAEELYHRTMGLACETALRLLVRHIATLPSLPQHLPVLKSLTLSLVADTFSAFTHS